MSLRDDQFTCAVCRETFKKAISDEEAKAELVEAFPGFGTGACDLVCDDCYNRMFPSISTHSDPESL